MNKYQEKASQLKDLHPNTDARTAALVDRWAQEVQQHADRNEAAGKTECPPDVRRKATETFAVCQEALTKGQDQTLTQGRDR